MKYIVLIAILLLGVTGFAQDKSAVFPEESILTKGGTYLDLSFGAGDTINESDTYYIEFTSFKDYPSTQNVYVDVDSVMGAPEITVTLQGKLFSTDTYVTIDTAVTQATGSGFPGFVIENLVSNRYRYYKLLFATTATDQQVTVEDVKFKIWYSGGQVTLDAITDGTATLSSGALSGATTGAFSGNVTIGGTLVNTGLITANGGVTLGAGDHLTGSATSNIVVNTDKFTVAGATGNTAVAGTLGVTGITTISKDADNVVIDPSTDLHVVDIQINSASKFSVDSAGNVVTAGTIDNVAVSSAAGGDKGLNESITQVAGTALTGNLIGAGIVATNGTTTAPTGVIYGIEAKARAANSSGEGGDVTGRLTGVYASVDVKAKEGTTIRAFEASLDGGAGGTSTEAVAFEAFNNSSAVQTNSYAFSANGGTASGHKAYTADLRLQNGETVSNATDGTVAVSGILSANLRAATIVVNTDESETLTAAQSGAFVTFDGAGTATLPDPSAATVGVIWYLLQTADADLIVTATTADNNAFVADNVATSDAVTLTGAGHKIGSGMMVIGISATKYFVMALNAESELTPEAAD